MNASFWDGFDKTASLSVRHLAGGAVRILKGSKAQKVIRQAAVRQGPVDFVTGLLAKGQKISKGKARDLVGEELKKMPLGGTISSGRKGSVTYLDTDVMKKHKMPQSLRNIVHHEEFHRKVPIVGKSEILAHMYGGLHDKKVKSVADALHNAKRSVKDLGHLAKTRPGRLAMEAGAIGGAGYGANELLKKKEHKKEAGSKLLERAVAGLSFKGHSSKGLKNLTAAKLLLKGKNVKHT